MTMNHATSFILQLLISLLLSHHIYIINAQSGQAPEQTDPPTKGPSSPPTPEYPKLLSFTLSLFMDGASFDEGNGIYTLDYLFRRTLCENILNFPLPACSQSLQRISPNPTTSPTTEPTHDPTNDPSTDPTMHPTHGPTQPTEEPTSNPTLEPTVHPTMNPTEDTLPPTLNPTIHPTFVPTLNPTLQPTKSPTQIPTETTSNPTLNPTFSPTNAPSLSPTFSTETPTKSPTFIPTNYPSLDPTIEPTTSQPSLVPTLHPSSDPTLEPTFDLTMEPTLEPTFNPTGNPSMEPTLEPTLASGGRRLLSIFDLDLRFFVIVNDKKESDALWNAVKRESFFDDYKSALEESLTSEWVISNYAPSVISDFEMQIDSMKVDEEGNGGNVDILSPTYSPTSHPTYDYEEGQSYGQWMVGIGIALITAFVAYWLYLQYTKMQYRKKESRTDKEGNGIEFQSLFDEEDN